MVQYRGAGGAVRVQMVQLGVQVVQSGFRWYSQGSGGPQLKVQVVLSGFRWKQLGVQVVQSGTQVVK